MIPLEYYLYIGAFLFCAGVVLVLTKRNAIVVLMGIELIFNAANINLVAFSQFDPQRLQGQIFTLFVVVIAAAEATVALAIVLKVYQHFKTIRLDDLNELKG
ncbi:NADH-quinone oxidoreductase subunit K [marine bacterium AO1-C]|nr:NADH-quinone oxidoreductase subunit K [marine bacterium AO1-C]